MNLRLYNFLSEEECQQNVHCEAVLETIEIFNDALQ